MLHVQYTVLHVYGITNDGRNVLHSSKEQLKRFSLHFF